MRSGNFLDLTAEGAVTDEALEAVRAEVEEAQEDAAAARRTARRGEANAQRRAELVCACLEIIRLKRGTPQV